MKGSLVKRGNAYSIVLNVRDPETGKRKQQWIAAGTNGKKAQLQLNDLLYQLEHGTYVPPNKLTVRNHVETWLKDYVAANLSPRTSELYGYICNRHILPRLGNYRLSDLNAVMIQNLYAEKLKDGLSNRTVQIIHNVLHKCLGNAIKLGMLYRNPLDSVERPKVVRTEMKTLNETDIHLILDRAQADEYYQLFYTILFTGMRRGEALALKWGDVNLDQLKMSVNKSLTYIRSNSKDQRLVIKTPKTARSRRYISLTPSNALVLREYRKGQDVLRQSQGLPPLDDADLVFSNAFGKPYLPDSITHAWVKLTRRCGLPGLRLHDCRHTYATLLLKKNVHPSVVAAQLGHASVSTTLDIYSHFVPQLQEMAASEFDNIVMGAKQTVSKLLAD